MSDIFKDNRRVLIYLLFSNFLLYFGYQFWQTTFNNYTVETMGIGAAQVGLVQAFREVPGLTGFLLGFLALLLSEVRIMGLSIVLMGVGVIMTGYAQSIPFLLLSTLLMSTGFHFFYPSNSAVVLMTVDKRDAPKVLGQLQSLGAVAAVLATGAIFFLAEPWGYRTLFTVIGGIVVVGGLALLPMGGGGDGLPPRRRVVLRKRYWLYYTLSFLMGSRRHIFTTFAIFLLVQKYGISVQTTAILFLVNSIVNTVGYRVIGNMVGRLGERLMLTINFTLLTFIFLGYAYLTYLPALFVLFVVDNVLFGNSIAVSTYFQKIALSREEMTSNLSMEQTINHISAIIVPIIGGTVWELYGSKFPFLIGAGIVLVSLVLTQFIRTGEEAAPVAVEAV